MSHGGEDDDEGREGAYDDEVEDEGRVKWGGLMAVYAQEARDRVPLPLCKHLLACMLAEWWGEALEMIEKRVVGRAEFAGWTAGWGG